MDTWEYCSYTVAVFPSDSLIAALNVQGAAGWDLVCIIPTMDDAGRNIHQAIFRRLKQ